MSTEKVQARVPGNVAKGLEELARARRQATGEEISASDLIREALELYLSSQGPQSSARPSSSATSTRRTSRSRGKSARGPRALRREAPNPEDLARALQDPAVAQRVVNLLRRLEAAEQGWRRGWDSDPFPGSHAASASEHRVKATARGRRLAWAEHQLELFSPPKSSDDAPRRHLSVVSSAAA